MCSFFTFDGSGESSICYLKRLGDLRLEDFPRSYEAKVTSGERGCTSLGGEYHLNHCIFVFDLTSTLLKNSSFSLLPKYLNFKESHQLPNASVTVVCLRPLWFAASKFDALV